MTPSRVPRIILRNLRHVRLVFTSVSQMVCSRIRKNEVIINFYDIYSMTKTNSYVEIILTPSQKMFVVFKAHRA